MINNYFENIKITDIDYKNYKELFINDKINKLYEKFFKT